MNEHIKNYCEEYIENESSPQFALLLKGAWGCGKTYFIQKTIEKYTDKTKNIKQKEIMYLSLFGVSQISEIDELVFQKLHPILSSKHFKFFSKVFRTLLKSRFNIELEQNEKNTIIFKTKKLIFEIKKLIIVDDIERCMLNPLQIFGYFSEYLYKFGIKIIFIGNEDDILERDETLKYEYLKIKEKTIGIDFSIKPERESAIDSFLKELSLDARFSYIKNICIDIMTNLKCNNLRIIRQCLYNLKILFDSLEEEAISNHSEHIERIFINLFIQKI